jgi:hypothetical protein
MQPTVVGQRKFQETSQLPTPTIFSRFVTGLVAGSPPLRKVGVEIAERGEKSHVGLARRRTKAARPQEITLPEQI